MADRFPLIVNSVSKKIEELVSGDNLDLTGNGIVISGDTGATKYLTTNGTTVFWGVPGDVYLTQTQTVTNKTYALVIAYLVSISFSISLKVIVHYFCASNFYPF